MAGIWDKFPYFWFSLAFLAFSLLILVGDRRQRRYCLVAGLLSAPYGLASLAFVPEYWDPMRVFTFCKTGPEDLLFSFANGVIVWKIANLSVQGGLVSSLDPRRVALRFGAISGYGIGLATLCGFLGFGVMTATMIAFGGTALLLLALRRDLWRVAVAGGVGYAVYYFFALWLAFNIWPGFLSQWNARNLWGPEVAGVPAEEVAWAFGYGFIFPMWMGWIFQSRRLESGGAEDSGPFPVKVLPVMRMLSLPGRFHEFLRRFRWIQETGSHRGRPVLGRLFSGATRWASMPSRAIH